jgi:polyhydroxyalkanoate synthesis repressor PhaR
MVAKDDQSQSEPIIIKKYANRRLYNTDTSTYVTLDDLAEMVRVERDFVVFDAKSGDDLTHAVLTQIIVDQESRGQSLLPIPFLRQLIRFYGDSIEQLIPSYLEHSMTSLTRHHERYRKQYEKSFGSSAIEAVQEQARQNLVMFEKAMGVFSPFDPSNPSAKEPAEKPNAAAAKTAQKSPARGGDNNEIDSLKAQLSAMQEQLDKLSRRID